ncbi:MAG TPA: hypothetical protein DCY00_06395 [Actinobacteria bacterium]|nr:hypothetical protein [Actinomycetota bacterium]
MTKKKLIVASLLVICVGFISGYSFGRSNLYGLYPSFNKMTPVKPFSKDSYWAKNYKMEVEEYIDGAKQYVEAANNDISTINDEINNAIRKANNVVDEYNNWVRYGY